MLWSPWLYGQQEMIKGLELGRLNLHFFSTSHWMWDHMHLSEAVCHIRTRGQRKKSATSTSALPKLLTSWLSSIFIFIFIFFKKHVVSTCVCWLLSFCHFLRFCSQGGLLHFTLCLIISVPFFFFIIRQQRILFCKIGLLQRRLMISPS